MRKWKRENGGKNGKQSYKRDPKSAQYQKYPDLTFFLYLNKVCNLLNLNISCSTQNFTHFKVVCSVKKRITRLSSENLEIYICSYFKSVNVFFSFSVE